MCLKPYSNTTGQVARSSPLPSSSSDRSRGTKTAVRGSREHVKRRRRIDDGRTQGRVLEQSKPNANTPRIKIVGKSTLHDYDNFEVPDDIDDRGAYGRRQSPDFGFPGARIKPRSISNIHESPLSSGDWVKRACGHFSRRSKSETGDDLAQKLCHRCLIKNTTRDERNDALFHDLSCAIDTILEEHTSTLCGIINDIKQGQVGRPQDQESSPDLASSKHSCPQQSLDCETAHPQSHGYLTRVKSGRENEETSAEMVERSAHGSDDPRYGLERSIKSFQDLYDLINSVADDLGLDLDRRPNKKDDEVFRSAPVQEATPTPAQVLHMLPESRKNNGAGLADQNDSGPEPACYQSNGLSGTRIQIVDEFGSVLEDISIQRPRLFEIKLSKPQLPIANDDGILILQIRRCSGTELTTYELDERFS